MTSGSPLRWVVSPECLRDGHERSSRWCWVSYGASWSAADRIGGGVVATRDEALVLATAP